MQIHSDDMVTAGSLQHVGHQLGSDRSPTLILLVLASIREVGQDGSDAAGRCSTAGVDQDEKFHDMVVDVARLCGLKYEDCAGISKRNFCWRKKAYHLHLGLIRQ
jgi:hypothetical protein